MNRYWLWLGLFTVGCFGGAFALGGGLPSLLGLSGSLLLLWARWQLARGAR